jgi:hypothetical protein
MSSIFEEVVAKLETDTPPSFDEVIAEFEKDEASKSIWRTGLWVPGMFECGIFCEAVKHFASV